MKLKLVAGLVFSPALAMAMDLTEYREVDSSYENSYINGQLNAADGNQEQASFNLGISGDYNRNISTEKEVKDFKLRGNILSSRGSTAGDSTVKSYGLDSTASYSSYFSDNHPKLFWFGSADIGARRLISQTETDDPRIKVSGGLGFGRIINATPFAKAINVANEFIASGILTEIPSKAVMHKFAQFIDKEDEYYGRFDSDKWEEKWLTDLIGFAKENFKDFDSNSEAIAVLSMRKILLEESINTRKHGYVVRAGTGYIVSNYEGEDETPSFDIYAEYAKPFGLRSQFINASQLSLLQDSASDYIFNNDMSYTYELNDEIDWENTWNLEYSSGQSDLVTNIASTALSFELSNVLDLTTTYQLSHLEDDVDDNGNDEIEQGFFVGVRYRLR